MKHIGYLFSVQEWMNGVKLTCYPVKIPSIVIGDKHTIESIVPKFPVSFFQSSSKTGYPLHIISFSNKNLLTFKTINFSQPPWLSSMMKSSCLTRGNRLLASARHARKAIGKCVFVMAAPGKWNTHLMSDPNAPFRLSGSQLKTNLFRLA